MTASRLILFAGAVSIAVWSSAAVGQTLAPRRSPGLWSISKIVGLQILDPDKAVVGTVADVLLDKDGTIRYLIIGVGGVLGLGEKTVLVPFDRVRFTSEHFDPPGNPPPQIDAGQSTVSVSPGPEPSGMPEERGHALSSKASGLSPEPDLAKSPDHGMVDMTSDDLRAMPPFRANPVP